VRPCGTSTQSCSKVLTDASSCPAHSQRSRVPPGVKILANFDRYKDAYRREVQKAIGFSGRDVEFFAQAKARVLLQIAERHLGRTQNLRVLDVGCGIGLMDRFLRSHVDELHGVDLSVECIAAATAVNPDVEYRSYDGSRLPYDDERFDLSFVMNVLHHIHMPERRNFISEMCRVTRSRGLVLVIEQNPLNPLTRLAVSRCTFDDGCELARRRAVERLFDGNGARLVETRYIMFLPWSGRFVDKVEFALRGIPLGAQYVVVGERTR